jgi:hypothetical protein
LRQLETHCAESMPPHVVVLREELVGQNGA